MESKIKVAFVFTACKQSGPIQQMFNLIKNLDAERFAPILITLYDEPTDGTSKLMMYTDFGIPHYKCPLGKKDILLGKTGALKRLLLDLKVDVIHSLGVFPDYAIARMNLRKQIITLRNFVWEDYLVKFGIMKGTIIAELHLYAMKRTAKTVACSESLARIYKERIHMDFAYVRNGVDVEKFSKTSLEEKASMRTTLGLPPNAFIFVYSGQMLDRKNQKFLLEVYEKNFVDNKAYLLLLGDGADYQTLKDRFGTLLNVDFRGNVKNVGDYLKASDAYVSTSKSEGMPNGVLEAMATGLPVILSDIPQHLEVYEADSNMGYTYAQGDVADLHKKMVAMVNGDIDLMGNAAYKAAHECFSARIMSENYQRLYVQIFDAQKRGN